MTKLGFNILGGIIPLPSGLGGRVPRVPPPGGAAPGYKLVFILHYVSGIAQAVATGYSR